MTNGSDKGANFERDIAKRLSRWMSGGQRSDLFWRTAMSGGQATVVNRAGGNIRSQLGDITSVDTEGAPLTDLFMVELKHQKHIALDSYLLKGTGPVAKWWDKLVRECREHDRLPMLIARQNRFPILLAVDFRGRRYLREVSPLIDAPNVNGGMTIYCFDDFIAQARPARLSERS